MHGKKFIRPLLENSILSRLLDSIKMHIVLACAFPEAMTLDDGDNVFLEWD
jgi:hypothetical protein